MKPESLPQSELNLEKFWLNLAKNIIEREWRGVIATGMQEGILYAWEPAQPDIFSKPIGLEVMGGSAKDDLAISSAVFAVDGDEVQVVKGIDNRLRSDPLADLILNGFNRIYAAHPHAVCIRTFRQQRQEQLRLQKIYERRRAQLDEVKY